VHDRVVGWGVIADLSEKSPLLLKVWSFLGEGGNGGGGGEFNRLGKRNTVKKRRDVQGFSVAGQLQTKEEEERPRDDPWGRELCINGIGG